MKELSIEEALKTARGWRGWGVSCPDDANFAAVGGLLALRLAEEHIVTPRVGKGGRGPYYTCGDCGNRRVSAGHPQRARQGALAAYADAVSARLEP